MSVATLSTNHETFLSKSHGNSNEPSSSSVILIDFDPLIHERILDFLEAGDLAKLEQCSKTFRSSIAEEWDRLDRLHSPGNSRGISPKIRAARYHVASRFALKIAKEASQHFKLSYDAYTPLAFFENRRLIKCAGCRQLPNLDVSIFYQPVESYELFVRLEKEHTDPSRTLLWEGFVPAVTLNAAELTLAISVQALYPKHFQWPEMQRFEKIVYDPESENRTGIYKREAYRLLNNFRMTVIAMTKGALSPRLIFSSGGYGKVHPASREDPFTVLSVMPRNIASHEVYWHMPHVSASLVLARESFLGILLSRKVDLHRRAWDLNMK